MEKTARLTCLALLLSAGCALGSTDARAAAIPSRLAGTYAAAVPNYPDLGLYAGRYRLTFRTCATVAILTVPGEGPITLGVNVVGNRITFLPAGVCYRSGTYLWSVSHKTLTFARVQDACRKRAANLLHPWRRTG